MIEAIDRLLQLERKSNALMKQHLQQFHDVLPLDILHFFDDNAETNNMHINHLSQNVPRAGVQRHDQKTTKKRESDVHKTATPHGKRYRLVGKQSTKRQYEKNSDNRSSIQKKRRISIAASTDTDANAVVETTAMVTPVPVTLAPSVTRTGPQQAPAESHGASDWKDDALIQETTLEEQRALLRVLSTPSDVEEIQCDDPPVLNTHARAHDAPHGSEHESVPAPIPLPQQETLTRSMKKCLFKRLKKSHNERKENSHWTSNVRTDERKFFGRTNREVSGGRKFSTNIVC